jgi:hypothetical protein
MRHPNCLDPDEIDRFITMDLGPTVDDTLELCEAPVNRADLCGAVETKECPLCCHYFCELHMPQHVCEGQKGTRLEE